MRITLCGSARFEEKFKEANRRLSLAGHVVYTLTAYPSDMGGKDWYTPAQKAVLDNVHLKKIANSDAVYVISVNGYVGESTRREIIHARSLGKRVLCPDAGLDIPQSWYARSCPFEGCSDPSSLGPCALCYE